MAKQDICKCGPDTREGPRWCHTSLVGQEKNNKRLFSSGRRVRTGRRYENYCDVKSEKIGSRKRRRTSVKREKEPSENGQNGKRILKPSVESRNPLEPGRRFSKKQQKQRREKSIGHETRTRGRIWSLKGSEPEGGSGRCQAGLPQDVRSAKRQHLPIG